MDKSQKPSLNVGTILDDKWVILEFIAKGGMGEVYRAHQTNLKRDVAIKVISKELLECIPEDGEEIDTALQRFQREVRAMAGIHHPNVLQIFDYGLETTENEDRKEPLHYIAMEFVPGDTLRETMSEEGFQPEEDLIQDWIEKYFLAVLDGVEAVHKRDMVHRDLKPENVLIAGTIPKIADFGLTRSCLWKGVTQSIDFKGTINYMPPEQLVDFRRTDHRADIYALGKILHEAIAGKTSTNNASSHLKSVGLKNPETSFFREMDQILRKATAENREERFQSVEAFRNAISKALVLLQRQSGENRMRTFLEHPKWIWGGISVAIMSVLIMTGWHLLGNPGQHTGLSDQNTALTIDGNNTPDIPARSDLKPPISTEDDATLWYVPGGTLHLPKKPPVTIPPFYMDETPVTNLQYVTFLNETKSKIRIENNVLTGDGKIWLMLGEVTQGYEPIIFADDKFAVKHPGHAACPALRVTGYGASAYARFYKKRLPTVNEWFYAYLEADEAADPVPKTCEQKPIPTPVILFDANILGIRGLNQCIDEWTTHLRTAPENTLSEAKGYTVAGNIRDADEKDSWYSVVHRQPWESFEEVGFRCVMDM